MSFRAREIIHPDAESTREGSGRETASDIAKFVENYHRAVSRKDRIAREWNTWLSWRKIIIAGSYITLAIPLIGCGAGLTVSAADTGSIPEPPKKEFAEPRKVARAVEVKIPPAITPEFSLVMVPPHQLSEGEKALDSQFQTWARELENQFEDDSVTSGGDRSLPWTPDEKRQVELLAYNTEWTLYSLGVRPEDIQAILPRIVFLRIIGDVSHALFRTNTVELTGQLPVAHEIAHMYFRVEKDGIELAGLMEPHAYLVDQINADHMDPARRGNLPGYAPFHLQPDPGFHACSFDPDGSFYLSAAHALWDKVMPAIEKPGKPNFLGASMEIYTHWLTDDRVYKKRTDPKFASDPLYQIMPYSFYTAQLANIYGMKQTEVQRLLESEPVLRCAQMAPMP